LKYIVSGLRISFKVTSILTTHVVGIILILAFSISFLAGIALSETDIQNATSKSSFSEFIPENGGGNASSQRTHSDLIKSCSTFRDILSTDMAFSCDYSMLYYKGQCERYSSLLKLNETEATSEDLNDFSFCADPRVDGYILEHGLTDAPRSPTLVPNYDSPIA
jgi:hypothetical protein